MKVEQSDAANAAGEARELELALMMADLCGYTALTETHGALQASETVLHFVRLVEASLQPGVRIVDSIGDAVFCASEDTQAVARTALRLRDLAAAESGFPRVSTGLHKGKVVERAGRLFGGPINLTARLTSQAEGGQLLCTEAIVQALESCADLQSTAMGEYSFKNVTRPVLVFELARKDEIAEIEFVDPVCRMQIGQGKAAASLEYGGRTYRFCSSECARAFKESPSTYGGDIA
jgi:adenylate cyclase